MSDKREVSVLVIADIGPVSGLTQGLAFAMPRTEQAPPPFHYSAAPVTGGAASKRPVRFSTNDRKSKMRKRDPLADAARWFVELITAADINPLWPKFEEWLLQDPKNRSAYEEMERMWAELYSAGTVWARKGVSSGPVMVRH